MFNVNIFVETMICFPQKYLINRKSKRTVFLLTPNFWMAAHLLLIFFLCIIDCQLKDGDNWDSVFCHHSISIIIFLQRCHTAFMTQVIGSKRSVVLYKVLKLCTFRRSWTSRNNTCHSFYGSHGFEVNQTSLDLLYKLLCLSVSKDSIYSTLKVGVRGFAYFSNKWHLTSSGKTFSYVLTQKTLEWFTD